MSGIIEYLADAFSYLQPVFSDASAKKTGRMLRQAGMRIAGAEYLAFALGTSLLASLFASLLFFAAASGDALLQTVIVFLSSLAASFALLLRYPAYLRQRRSAEMERDLPYFLRSLGAELDMRMQFEQALRSASCHGVLGAEMRRALRNVESGSSIPEALLRLAETVDSTMLKRSVAQVISAYQSGGGGAPLKRLADEMISQQRAAARQFSAQLAFLGLAFIAVSSIVPSLFNAFVVVGSSFMSVSFSATQIYSAYLLLFPALNVGILAFVAIKTPAALKGGQTTALRGGTRERLPVSTSLIASLGLCALAAALLLLLNAELLPLALLPLAIPVVYRLMLAYAEDKRRAEIEQYLPDALFMIASLPRGARMEKALLAVATSDYGALSEEFAAVCRRIKAGAGIPEALQAMAERNGSLLLSRAVELLVMGYKTGADISGALRETAEDIFEFSDIVRERGATLAMQKYTLLVAGGLLVPVILGMLSNLVFSLDLSGAEQWGIGLPAQQRAELLSAATNASQAYLVIYSVISGFFVALQEGQTRRFVVYAAVLAPVTLLLFNAARLIALF
jgi:pilus assembly protein TadC